MKKLFLSLSILFVGLFTNAQDSKSYLVTRSEWYLYNDKSEEWVLQDKNSNVKIDMVVYKNVINIQAKTPTLFRLDEDSKETIKGKKFSGYRYSAIECVEMKKCDVDIVRLEEDESIFLFSVIFTENGNKFNLRYYANLE